MKTHLQQILFGTSAGSSKALNIGLLLFRLHIGLSIAIHAGWPKMNTITAPGWFTEQVAGLGFTFPSPGFWAAAASWGEFAGGLCIALGLLTRFSALQLAFQFFVISFLWYEEPEPITGMYFQQTLFFGFILLIFTGAGRYSIDQLIINRKKLSVPLGMKAAVTSLLLFCLSANAQSVTINDYKPLEGKWTGQLTYLDYGNNTKQNIPANAMLVVINENEFDLSLYYTEEPDHNTTQRYVISNKGEMVNDKKVIERTKQADGSLKIILESRGSDGNDPQQATFQDVIFISETTFIMIKLVKYDGEKEFFERNRYSFSR